MRTLRRALDQEMYSVSTVDLLFTLTVVETDYKTYVWTGTLTDLKNRETLFTRTDFGGYFDIGIECSIAREMLLTATTTVTDIRDNLALRASVMKIISDI